MPAPSAEQDLQEIVAKAYAAIAKPDQMVELIAELAKAEERIDDFSEKADAHLANAANILETLYPTIGDDYGKISTQRRTKIDCDLALDGKFAVISYNPDIFETGDLQKGGIAVDWLLDPSTTNRTLKQMREMPLDSAGVFLQLFVTPTSDTGRWFSVIRTVTSQGETFVFDAVRLRWHENAGQTFQTALKLTDTEIELTKHLVTGGKVRSFAELRGRSIGTARNQLKALQRKLAISSKEDLLLLYAGFVHSVEMPKDHTAAHFHQCANIFDDPVSGEIAWEEHGDPGGVPVVYFHPLEGALMTHRISECARQHGLRIIAPWRPYYGDTLGNGWSIESAIKFAPRVSRLLDHLGIDKAVGLTTQAGTQFLMAMAQNEGHRLKEAVCVAGYMPFVAREDFATIPKAHEYQMRLARMVPAFARIYQKAMLASIRDGEFYRFVENFYRDCPRELAVLRDPEVLSTIRRSAAYIFLNGYDGTIDTMLSWAADWSSLCKGITIPVRLIAGDEDRAMPHEFLRRAARTYGFDDPVFVPATGGFLINEQPDYVMQYLKERFDAS